MTDLQKQFLFMMSDQESQAKSTKHDVDSASFIIRIWKETANPDGNMHHWRGVIEQVGQPKQFYFQELSAIPRFISEQLSLHADDFPTRLRFWINQWMHAKHDRRKET